MVKSLVSIRLTRPQYKVVMFMTNFVTILQKEKKDTN